MKYNTIKIASKIYVQDEYKNIYQVTDFRQLDSKELALTYSLEQIASYDYINPDMHDLQGYITNDTGIDCITVFSLTETLAEQLEDNNYTIIESLPKIYEQFIILSDDELALLSF